MSSSTSLPNVALIGATGYLGRVILEKLLAADFPVTIVTREGSTSTDSLPAHPDQTIKSADYTSKSSLVTVLTGTNVVISSITTTQTSTQVDLVDAALATGTVTRFLPAEFGTDIYLPANQSLPVFHGKLATTDHLKHTTATHPHFSWTAVQNYVFFEWGLTTHPLVMDPRSHTATLWGGGDVPFSVTTLATIADTVVAVLRNPEASRNRVVKVHDAVVTQNQLIDVVKRIDGRGWHTAVGDIAAAEQAGYEEFKKPQPDVMAAIFGVLTAAVYGPGRQVYASQVDNKEFGIKEMSVEEVEEVVRKMVKGLGV